MIKFANTDGKEYVSVHEEDNANLDQLVGVPVQYNKPTNFTNENGHSESNTKRRTECLPSNTHIHYMMFNISLTCGEIEIFQLVSWSI